MPRFSKKSILETLSNISADCQGIVNINFGGCCIFAAMILEKLELCGFNCSVGIASYSEIKEYAIESFPSVCHCLIIIKYKNKEYIYDSDGMVLMSVEKMWGVSPYKYKISELSLNSNNLYKIYNFGSWNYRFDTDNIEKIQFIIDDNFNKLIASKKRKKKVAAT